MFSSEQYRAKAAEYLELAAKTESPNEIREFGDLERSYTGGYRGTEVELVRTAGSYPDVVCVRVLGEQSCAWTFRLGIEPVATYDREQAETKSILDHQERTRR
jgi:hypothetical protein